jgi:hypothetical protein
MDVSRHILILDTSILTTSNMNRREYIKEVCMITSGAIQYGVPFNERLGAAVLNW